jgi:hypothetical protein
MPKVTFGARDNPLLEFPLEDSVLSSSQFPTPASQTRHFGNWGDERDLATASAFGIAAAICAVLLWLWF